MKSSTRRNIRDRKSEHENSGIRLKNGELLPIEVITSFLTSASESFGSAVSADLNRETDFKVFGDGTQMDLVRDASGKLIFVLFRNEAFTFHPRVRDGGLILLPPQIHGSLSEAICFPMTIGENHSARELLDQIDDVLCCYLDFESSDRKLLAYFALYSWVSDFSAIAPYLWVVGPYASGKTTVLRLLSAMCRRSVLAGDISAAALYTLTDSVHPTLLIDEFELGNDARSRDLQRLLRSGSTRGERVVRASRAYDVFGPKVIASRRGPSDPALDSRGLQVIARPASRAVAILTPNALLQIERQLQPKFLAFRLNNYLRLLQVNPHPTMGSCLTSRVRDIFRALIFPVIGDIDLERELLAIVAPHDSAARIDRYSEPESAVMIALLRHTHVRGPGAPTSVTAKQLAGSVNYVLEQSGESYRLTPRKVGEIVRALGFRTGKLGSLGRGVEFSKEFVSSVHKTAKRFGICTADLVLPDVISDGFVGTCLDCEREGLMTDNEGKKLRYEEFSLGPALGPEID